MTIIDYLDLHRMRSADLARLAGVSRPMISLLIVGKRRPSMATIEKLMRATGGAVTANDFVTQEIAE